MNKILIVYGSKHGQTEKISNFIKEKLASKDFNVEIVNIKNHNFVISENYQAIIIASSINVGGHLKDISKFIAKNLKKINSTKSYFLSVGIGICSKKLNEQEKTKKMAIDFCSNLKWDVTEIKSVAGALAYTKYNFLLKLLCKTIASILGLPNKDLSKDYEFTDWKDLESFINKII